MKHMTNDYTKDQIEAILDRELPDRHLSRLAEPDRFSGDMSGDASASNAVEMVFNKSDSSWRTPPRAKDLEAALRGYGTRSRRRFVLSTYIMESTFEELAAAEREHAFTWKRLVTALHRDGITEKANFVRLNELAR